MVESIKELREICQKKTQLYNKKGEENTSYPAKEYIYDRFLRLVSIYITKLFLYTPITSNQVSVLSMVVGIVAGLCFISQKFIFWFAGFLLLQLFHFLDAVDGEVARYRKDASPIGKVFDVLAHNVVIAAFFIGITIGTYNSLNNPFVFLFGLICLASSLISPLSTALSSSLIYHYAILENEKKIIEHVQTSFNAKPTKRTIRYTIRRFLGFDGLPFMALGLILLDSIFTPLNIKMTSYIITLNFRFLFLIISSFVGLFTVAKKMRDISKLKKKYFN